MATKTIYFTVNGRPEQAEFPVDCPPLDIKGKDWWLGSQLSSDFKHKTRLDDCSQKITEVWAVLTEEKFKVIFVGGKKHRSSSESVARPSELQAVMQLLLTACHSIPRSQTTFSEDYPHLLTILWHVIDQTIQLFFRIIVSVIEDIKIVLTCSLFFFFLALVKLEFLEAHLQHRVVWLLAVHSRSLPLCSRGRTQWHPEALQPQRQHNQHLPRSGAQ